MRHLKPTTVILAFAFMSFASAKAITTVGALKQSTPSAEAELLALARSETPVIIEDRMMAATDTRLEASKLILTAMSTETTSTADRLERAHGSTLRLADNSAPAAAAPAKAAATIVNKSATEQKFAVDSGATEKVYTVAPGASVALENCEQGCTATGPWGYSRAIKAGEVVETSGVSEVTTTKVAASKPTVVAKAAVTKKKHAKAGKSKQKVAKVKPQKYNPYFKGSFTSLFTGIVR